VVSLSSESYWLACADLCKEGYYLGGNQVFGLVKESSAPFFCLARGMLAASLCVGPWSK